jgi:HTH-type transcriptional regulator/antitoxin HigA
MEALPPLVIASDAEYRRMQKTVDELAICGKLNKGQQRYLETLTILVEDYERKHHAIDTAAGGPTGVLKFLMREHGMSTRDLGRILGQPQLGSKILRGERALSKEHIRRLCQHFSVNPSLFF